MSYWKLRMTCAMMLFCASWSALGQQSANVETAFGIQLYPGAVLLEDQTRRLEAEKLPNRLAVAAYQANDDLKDVIKHFKAQSRKAVVPLNPDPVLKTLLRDNWKKEERSLIGSYSIFGVNHNVVKTLPALSTKKARISFGVITFGDSLVRIHLMSPYLSADSTSLVNGTLIVLVRERLPQPNELKEAGASANAKERVYSPREVTRKARIRSRPEPEYTSEARAKGVSGVVVIKAVFSSDGKVTNIRVIKELPYGLTEEAVRAARQIKFDPAIKDGREVSQHIQIEYYFFPRR